MNELSAMFERQAVWQRSRARMSWTDKLRLAGELRKAAIALRKSGLQEAAKVAEKRGTYGRP